MSIRQTETLIVPTGRAGFAGVVKGNDTFGTIVRMLQNSTTEDAIIARLQQTYTDPYKQIQKDVQHIVSELRKIGAIDDE